MNNRRWLILAGLGLITAVSLLTIYSYSKKRSGNIRIKNKKPKSILIVGDSQSAIVSSDGKPISWTYPNFLQKKLSNLGVKIDVLASIGKTTKWMKESLAERLKSAKYDRIYIYGGGNDASNASIDLEKSLSNVQSMVDMSNKSGADTFVNLGYRIDNFSDYRKMPLTEYITDKTQWIPLIERRKVFQKMLRSVKNTNFVPVYDLNGLTNDGIHPTQEGHKIIAQKVYNTIA